MITPATRNGQASGARKMVIVVAVRARTKRASAAGPPRDFQARQPLFDAMAPLKLLKLLQLRRIRAGWRHQPRDAGLLRQDTAEGAARPLDTRLCCARAGGGFRRAPRRARGKIILQ